MELIPSPRYLINFGVFQMATATVATVATGAPTGVSGTVRFFQNPFIANDNSRWTVEIVGLPVNTAFFVCLLPTNVVATPVIAQNFGTNLAANLQPVVSISIPFYISSFPDRHLASYFQALTNNVSPGFQLFNRFTVKGSNAVFNIDAASARRDINNVGVGIFTRACAGTALGTTANAAAPPFAAGNLLARTAANFV